ncbi:hypothetical protein J4227_01640 [Candidatus Woesearchaeota archaeon]|nr:hypothetical protein [Candidatus Woesearchaeota archaeon]
MKREKFCGKGQSTSLLFWIIFAVLLLLAGLAFVYFKFQPATNDIFKFFKFG